MTYAPFSSVLNTFLPSAFVMKSSAMTPGALSSIHSALTSAIAPLTCSPLTVTTVGSDHASKTLYSNAVVSPAKSTSAESAPPTNLTALSDESVKLVIASEGVLSLILNSCAPTVAKTYLSPPTALTLKPLRFHALTNAISVYSIPSVV